MKIQLFTMKKIIAYLLLLPLLFSVTAKNSTKSTDFFKKTAAQLKMSIPDSSFKKIRPGNLLNEATYLKLAKEGWNTKEIFAITDEFTTNNKKNMGGSFSYSAYSKDWKPYWYMLAPNDTIKHLMNPAFDAGVQKAFSKAFKADIIDYNPRLFYTPTDRMNGIRNPGYFRHNAIMPSVGRIHFIQPHPTDSDKLMIIPDGDGIWRTDNNGKTWDPVSDRIPNRFHRAQSSQFVIPVDPDDWNHFFAFMDGGSTTPVYETVDGGQNWSLVTGATHKPFKKGYAFRDAAGTLKFIGVERSLYTTWDGKLWISENKGVAWRQIVVPGTKNWLQEFAFDPSDRNTIYITTGLGILRSTDGLAYVNGKYNLSLMSFKVYNRDRSVLRSDGTSFPFDICDGPMILKIDPKNSNKMWAALGRKSAPLNSAVYYSEDKGLTWITLTDTYNSGGAAIGSGQVFGNEAPGGWLGDFAVNFTDPNLMYGCTMSSAKSSNGGKNFNEFAWGIQMRGLHPDGKFYNVSSSRHNADNHTMATTPSGRIFRASDAGILMIDKKINGGEWANISGNMGQLLIYKARINEFGDQTIIENTQDCDAQTYRYGRWGAWRGYEGTTAAINPMSNETYFSGGGGGSLEGTSWGDSWKEGYGRADVATGNWYLWRSDRMIGTGTTLSDFGVVADIGRSVQPLFTNTASTTMTNKDFALCRDTAVGSALFVLRNDGNIVRFDNESTTYTMVPKPTFNGYNPSSITVNPDNVKEIYVADNANGILKTTNSGGTWNKISSGTNGIPSGVSFNNLYYHEGSGDIYAISNGYGIFLNQAGSTNWTLWMKGYNPSSFGGAQIGYSTQEMMVFDYGRGTWLADLQNPANRFFKQGFKVKQLSNINGLRTFGIDTKLDIPLYQNYQWYVNGQAQTGSQYKTFSSNQLNENDKIQLKLTLREAPDVVTTSAILTIASDPTKQVNFSSGRAIQVAGTGRMDLGHQDYFGDNFTVEMWVKPVSTDNCVLIGNRKLESREQQGWLMGIFSGSLKFIYSPQSQFNQPSYETSVTQEQTVNAGVVTANKWIHVAVSVERNGAVKMYVNGVLKTTTTRILPLYGLNSVQPLSLFADGYEYNPANATIDELRIWKKALTLQDIREKMCAQPTNLDANLVYYNDFNAENTQLQKETITQSKMRSRTRAIPSYPEMTLAVCANQSKYSTINSVAQDITNNATKLVSIRTLTTRTTAATIYRFDNVYTASTIRGMSPDHFDVAPYTYKIDMFDALASTDSIEVRFFVPNAANYNGDNIFLASSDKDEAVWSEKTKAKYDALDESIVARFKATEVNGQLIAIIKAKPAIALTFPAASLKGAVPVFRETQNTIAFTAALLKSMPQPTSAYSLLSSRPFATPNPLTFNNGTASSSLTIITDSLGVYNSSSPVTISGMDTRMIPYKVDILNKIAPTVQGTSLKFVGGGATIGTSSDYAPLNLSNTITMMGWVRLDDTLMVSTSNTTVRPLIFFRGGGYTTGIHLDKGELRCHWNEESWSWGLATGLKLTKANLGKWVHIAMVTNPTSISFYLNGRKFSSTRSMSKTHILSPLMLGRNADGDTWFKGAFDQVSLWNRSLSEAEVMKYMNERMYNDETGLVASLNMDARNETGSLVEMKSNSVITFGGTVEQNAPSTFPFTPSKQSVHNGTTVTSTTDLTAVEMPGAVSGNYYLTQYEHLPYNFAISGLPPVSKGFFTVSFVNAQTVSVTDSITFICRQPSIIKGDEMQLVVRKFGSDSVFVSKASTRAIENGLAQCKVSPLGLLADKKYLSVRLDAFEAMWVTNPTNLQVIKLSIDSAGVNKIDLNKVILKDNELGIPINIERTSSRVGGKIDLLVRESNFARFVNSEIDLSSNTKASTTLIIDRSKVNPLALNNVQISFIGATGTLLNFKCALEPVAQIALKNGTAEDKITAKSSTVMLELDVKQIQGVAESPITLDITGDMNYGVSIGTGYLSTSGNVIYNNLDYFDALNPLNAGWNLVTNPYLVSLLLSKQENRTLDNVSVYFYQFNPKSKNFIAYDTRYFDSNMWLKPMEPFFVQTQAKNASLTLNASAKNKNYNKRNTAFFALSQVQEIGMELWVDGAFFDRTSVRFDNSASIDYVFDEDASKMPSFDVLTPQIYSLNGNNRYSINTLPLSVTEIPLGVKAFVAGTYTFKIIKASQDASTVVEFVDPTNNKILPITQIGDIYTVSLPASTGSTETRFKLRVSSPNGLQLGENTSINMWAEHTTCHIDGLNIGTKVALYDASGKKVIDQVANSSNWSTKLPVGIYMVNLNFDAKEYKGKIIIK